MAYRRPVVSTTPGCAGLEVVAGRDLLVADEPEDFARAIVSLLDDRLADRLISASGDLVSRLYDADATIASAAQLISSAVRPQENIGPVPTGRESGFDVSDLATFRPMVRPDLDVNEVPDGLIIYDGESDRVHYLNHTAALIFCLCTGDASEVAIAQEVQATFSLDATPDAAVASCLADFAREGLLA